MADYCKIAESLSLYRGFCQRAFNSALLYRAPDEGVVTTVVELIGIVISKHQSLFVTMFQSQ